jgi:tetratricopeptide (TPR) repeat protein
MQVEGQRWEEILAPQNPATLAELLRDAPLPPREAAELVEKLARAVEASHWDGAAPGGLQPATMQFAPEGTWRLANSASARTAKDPRYLAPEQLPPETEAGPETDVFTLGQILYEALTGRPPFCGPGEAQTRKQIRTHAPVPPRRIQPHTPRPLQTICLKCLRKNPRRRYANPRALADDLRRYLEGRRILARREPFWERAAAFARRSPAAAAAWLALGLAFLLATGMLERYRRNLAEEAQEKHARYEAALEAAEALNADVTEAARRLAGSDPSRAAGLLAASADLYDRLLAEDATPRALFAKARLLDASAELYLELNDSAGAEQAAREAVTIHDRLVKQSPRLLTYQFGLAQSRARLADVLRVRRPLTEVLQGFQQAEEMLRRLASLRPSDPEYRHALAQLLSRLGSLYFQQGALEQAGAAYEEAFALASETGGQPADPWGRRLQLARCYEQRADLLRAYAVAGAGLDDALDQYRAARLILEELQTGNPMEPRLRHDGARVTSALGAALALQGRREEAQAEFTRALGSAEDELQHNPRHTFWKMQWIEANIALHESLTPSQEVLDEQLPMHDELISLLGELAAEDSDNRQWPSRKAAALSAKVNTQLRIAGLEDESQTKTGWQAVLATAQKALAAAAPLIERDPDDKRARMAAILAHRAAANAAAAINDIDQAALHRTAAIAHLQWLNERNRLAPAELALIGEPERQAPNSPR